jgi:ABC-type branched-subunit amino acid transport system ATPase component
MTLLKLSNLTSGYDGTVILRDINLTLNSGKILCLLGRNGVGKSTLLKTIMGSLRKIGGEIFFDNKDLSNLKSHEIARLGVSYAAQESAIFSTLSVEENLFVGSKKTSISVDNLKKVYGYFPILEKRLTQKAGSLSGGEKKMLLLSRTLLNTPKLMVLDEITEGVQPSVINSFKEALLDINANSGTTILLTEQHLNFAMDVADEFAVMNQGMIIESGNVDSTTSIKVRKFLTL